MKPEDILNADIRVIDPRYDRRWNSDIYTTPELGFGCLDKDGLYVVRIPQGWDLLQQIRRSRFQHQFSLPTHNPVSGLMDRFLLNKVREVEMSRGDFKEVVLDFINQVVFGRLEAQVRSIEDYLELKHDMPLSHPRGKETLPSGGRVPSLGNSMFVGDIERAIYESPHSLGLPGRPQRVYREVRLDTKLARCVVRDSEFESIFQPDTNPCYALTICDYVLQYSSCFYVIEVKFGNPNKRISKGMTPREKAVYQLCDASTFFQNNFGVNPLLMRISAMGGRAHSWRAQYEHFRYVEGKRVPVKFEKFLLPRSIPYSRSREVA